MKKYGYISLILLLLVGSSCNKDDKNKIEFDRDGMLQNIGTNIIMPSYANLKEAVDQLNDAANDFVGQPEIQTLNGLHAAWIEAYMKYQRCSTYEFGPADEVLFRMVLNQFPTKPTKIEDNIESGSYNLEAISNYEAKGFPAIEYLIYNESGNNDAIITSFTAENSQSRKQYLLDLVNDVKENVDYVHQKWEDNYLDFFIKNNGSDAGSSLGFLVNQLNFDYELLKNKKLGEPYGIKSLGPSFPKEVEAYYSAKSKDLALEHLQSIIDLFLGKGSENGLGFDDYLNALDAKHAEGNLTDVMIKQLETAKSALEEVPDPLSTSMTENRELVKAAYDEVQKQVRYFKSDMPSALGVVIQYTDNDGD